MYRRIHRRNLSVFTQKRHNRPGGLFFCHLHFALFQYFPRSVLGIRFLPKQHLCPVFLIRIRKHTAQFGGAAEADRQDANRIRIQSTGMADFFLFQDASQLCHHIVGSIAGLLIYIYHSVVHLFFSAVGKY